MVLFVVAMVISLLLTTCLTLTLVELLRLALDSGVYRFQWLVAGLSASKYTTYVSIPLASAIAGGLFGLGIQDAITGFQGWLAAGRGLNYPPEFYIGFTCIILAMVVSTALPLVAHRIEQNTGSHSIYAKVGRLAAGDDLRGWSENRKLIDDIAEEIQSDLNKIESRLGRSQSRTWIQPTIALTCSSLLVSMYFLLGTTRLQPAAILLALIMLLVISSLAQQRIFQRRRNMEVRELERKVIEFENAKAESLRRMKREFSAALPPGLDSRQRRRIRRLPPPKDLHRPYA